MKRIMVIEDEKDVRENIIELLTSEEFTAIGAENGGLGVRLAREMMPDMILCDILMPGIDGYGVLAALRHDPLTAAIPFIFITARVTREDSRKGMDRGADDYITKPFTRQELLNAIHTRFEKQKVLADQIAQKTSQIRLGFVHSLPNQIIAPVEVILSSSEQLINEGQNFSGEQIIGTAGRINRSARVLLHTIQNYFFYAELDFIRVNPSDLPERTASCSSNVIEEMAVEISRNYERTGELDCNIQKGNLSISELFLQKIVEELVDNAFKFSARGTGVHISGKAKPDKFHYELDISDNGEGMSIEKSAYYNSVITLSHFSISSLERGIGLILAKRLVEKSQGDFRIESTPAKGTQVRVVLPMARMDALGSVTSYN